VKIKTISYFIFLGYFWEENVVDYCCFFGMDPLNFFSGGDAECFLNCIKGLNLD
jgi:hypothetical protein